MYQSTQNNPEFYLSSQLERIPVKHPNQDDLFGLIHRMIKTQKADRIPIQQIRTKFDSLKRNSLINLNSFAQTEIERIATQNLPPELIQYSSVINIIFSSRFYDLIMTVTQQK